MGRMQDETRIIVLLGKDTGLGVIILVPTAGTGGPMPYFASL